MNKKSGLLICLSMITAVAIFGSWLRCQERYVGYKDRLFVRYTAQDSIWKKLDYGTFLTLNGTMKDRPAVQILWGIANHRAFDLAAACWMVLLFAIYYVRNPRQEDRAAILQFGLYMSAALATVAVISELTVPFHRLSPGETGELRSRAVMLSELKDRITWTVKDGSNNSYPGDHAMVLMFIGSFIIYRLRSWYGWAAGFGIVAFMLPRLAGGGHWLSDILAGSLFFFLLLFPVFIFKPLRERGMAFLRKPAVWIHGKLSFLAGSNKASW